jgi:hypothetical protein
VDGALDFSSRQRLAQVGCRAQFALSTPKCAGQGRVDGGPPKFFYRTWTDVGSILRSFLYPTHKPTVILRVEAI